ncbi:MAG: DUF4019 domain-containing protein [Burkholderiaceae bacterium]
MQDDTRESLEAALAWLINADAGDYALTWEQAASYARVQVPKAEWVEMMARSREPLGEVIDRIPVSSQRADELPGAPSGEYAVHEFRTVFSGGAELGERVTTMRDGDGQLRVAGYYLV